MSNLKKTMLVILTLCISTLLAFIGSVNVVGNVNVLAINNFSDCTKDLSYTRKTYVSSENIGYTSTAHQGLPFGSALTNISVGSTSENSFQLENPSSKDVPVVLINSAENFIIQIDFADKVHGSLLYQWTTNSRPNKSERTKISDKYFFNSDSWGETNGQTIYANGLNVTTGKIGTGALVVQTSNNGDSWTNQDKSKYSNGLYTTDVLNYYHGTAQTYTLDGSVIKQGSYVSVSFFYEVKREYTNYYTTQERHWYQFGFIGGTHTVEHYEDVTEYKNICETYTFYVIEDNPEVVTFNNLTLTDQSEDINIENTNSKEHQSQSNQDNNSSNTFIDQITSTMYNGDMTTSGFRINVTANEYLNVSINRNGSPYTVNKQYRDNQIFYEITESGKYDIAIKSYSQEKNITIFVDNVSTNEAFQRYFGNKVLYNGQCYGNEFLDYSPHNAYGNMRIFDAYSNVPVFVGSLTLHLKEQTDESTFPLHGVITNKSTNQISFIDSNQINLTEYGEYEILFSSNSDYYEKVILNNPGIEMAGDVRVYKFNFKLVGNDNDTTVNEQILSTGTFKDLTIISPSDYNPKFYGVKRSTSNKGEVIIAFANRESALNYAKQVAWGEIEIHKDSNGNTYWLVPNLDNPLAGKAISYSGWKNAEIIKKIAEKMVEERYFDLTKSSSYLTLGKNVKDLDQENIDLSKMFTDLQLESLRKSVIVWYDLEQRNAALVKDIKVNETPVIKFISKQDYALLTKDEKHSYSQIETGEQDYIFIKDSLGIDSHTITAEDILGNQFSLNYETGLYSQLKDLNCAAGLIKITETNIYNVITAQYYVYYIPENYKPATITITADEEEIEITQANLPEIQTFKQLTIQNITDYADPFTYVRITDKNTYTALSYYSLPQVIGMEFTTSGYYEIAIIDRFGNCLAYEFSIDTNQEVSA